MDDERLEITPAGVPGGQLARSRITGDAELLGEVGGRVLTSLDLSSERGRRLFMMSTDGTELDGILGAGREIVVSDFVARDAVRNDKRTGEQVQCVRLTLLAPDGTTWSTTSYWCIRSFRELFVLFGEPPWPNGRRLRIVRVKTSGGNFTYKLRPVEETVEGE